MPHAPSNANTSGWAGRKLPLSWIIFPSIFLVYLLFPTKNYYWDGVFFARVIEAAPGFDSTLFHPNHLLYNVAGYVLYRMTRALGLQWRAIEVLQVANSVVSILTAYVLYLILRRTLRSDYLVWCLTLILAFSSTWWKFSTDANAYIFSVFFLLLGFYFTRDEFKTRPVIVALIFSVATLLHQLAVVAYPVVALALYRQSTGMPSSKRKLIVAQFCVLSFLIVFTIYCCSFYLQTGFFEPAGFARWITSYSPDASFSFDFLSNLGYTLRGTVRLFFNARLSLLRGLLSPAIVVLIAIFILVVLLWFAALIRRTRVRDLIPKQILARAFVPGATRLYVVWIFLYTAFLFFWLPHNTFYRLFYLPTIILLFGELLARSNGDRKRPTYRLGLFVAVMVLFNFLFFIYPYTRVEKYPPLSLALEMNNVWRSGTVVYFQSENSDNSLVAYINPKAEWRTLRTLDQLDAELKQLYAEGKTAWLDASAIDQLRSSPEGNGWLARHGRNDIWYERKARGYNIKFIQVGP